MKIGIVCPYNMVKGGGVQEIVKTQAKGLRQRGHQVTIITPRPPGYNGNPPDRDMVFVGRSTDVRLPTRTTVQMSINGSETADKLLEEGNFDILHFHEPWVPSLGQYMLPRSQAVNVATFHGKLPEGATVRAMSEVFKPYAKSLIKYVDEFVAASEAGSEYISSLIHEPVAIVPVDIDLTKFKHPAKFNDDKPVKTILYVGRLEGRKGVRYLLHAYNMLREKRDDVRLEILGAGPGRFSLQAIVRAYDIPDVEFLGFVDNDEKVRRFADADLFCAPSIYGEGLGMVLLEAMATGLPTVAGDNPGYASVMKGFGAVSLVNPRDTEQFARRLELFLYEKELRDSWRKWAAEEVEHYSTEHMLDKYEAIYEHALKRKRS